MTGTTTERMAMFPLSTIVFPGSIVPLHVFEPRYQRLTADCLAGDSRFGIVLITRGREVGGGDERAPVGTEVMITKAVSLADGRWLLMARGERLIRMVEWLEDDPYPQAMVQGLPSSTAEVEPALLQRGEQAVRRTRALLAESGSSPALPPDAAFDPDPALACWQLCAEAPLTLYDGQRLLAIEGTVARLDLLIEILGEVEDDLRRMMSQ